MINNRQAGRRRGRGTNGGGGGGNNNGQRQNGGGGGRPDSGNRIDSRARGNANQLYEKYKNLARDAQMQGDRVNIEYYLQFADHYFRVLNDSRSRFEENQPRRPVMTEPFDINGDDEYGDEGEPIRANEQQDGNRAEPQQRYDRDDRPQRDQQQARPQREQYQPRDAQRENGQRENGQRDGNQQREARSPRDNVQRDNGQRDNGQQREVAQRETAPREQREPREEGRRPRLNGNYAGSEAIVERPPVVPPVIEPANDRADIQVEAAPVVEEPRRRGRPRRDRSAEETAAAPAIAPAPLLDAERLPPSLGLSAVASEEPEVKPRRRRVRATPDGEASQAS